LEHIQKIYNTDKQKEKRKNLKPKNKTNKQAKKTAHICIQQQQQKQDET